jgi:hypothetical protein
MKAAIAVAAVSFAAGWVARSEAGRRRQRRKRADRRDAPAVSHRRRPACRFPFALPALKD